MKIVNNVKSQSSKPVEAGEIVKGDFSGEYYMVLKGAGQVLNLHDYEVRSINTLMYTRTHIKKENVTITFN